MTFLTGCGKRAHCPAVERTECSYETRLVLFFKLVIFSYKLDCAFVCFRAGIGKKHFVENGAVENFFAQDCLFAVVINGLESVENTIKDVVSDVAHSLNENVIKKYIIGIDKVIYKENLGGATYEVTEHEGADLFVLKKNMSGEFLGWSLNINIGNSKKNLSSKLVLSGEGLNPSNWKIKSNVKLKSNYTGLSATGSLIVDKNGLGYSGGVGGTSGTMPFKLPDNTVIEDFGSINWSLVYEGEFADWKQVGEGVISLAAIVALVVLVVDDGTGIGALDNTFIPGILTYLSSHLPALAEGLMKGFRILIPATCTN